LPLRLVLPVIEPVLAENVAKEIRKDALVIRCAAQCLASGKPPGSQEAERLLAQARDIDRQFLDGAAGLPLRLEIPYARIEPLRRRRIEQGLELAYRILNAWQNGSRLRDALPAQELESRLRDMLALYCEETAELGRGVRASSAISALRERAAHALRDTMRDVARQLAREAAQGVHRSRIAAQKNG
jgi:hypothetical protein